MTYPIHYATRWQVRVLLLLLLVIIVALAIMFWAFERRAQAVDSSIVAIQLRMDMREEPPEAWCPKAVDGRIRARARYMSPYRSMDAGILTCWYFLPPERTDKAKARD